MPQTQKFGQAPFGAERWPFRPGIWSGFLAFQQRLSAMERRRWMIASHDATVERRVAGAERRLSMMEWRHSVLRRRHASPEMRLPVFGRRVAMIATRIWTMESRLPAIPSRLSGFGMRRERRFLGRRGSRRCAGGGEGAVGAVALGAGDFWPPRQKKRAALGQPLMLCSAGDQTTASCFSFFTCMNCSRLTPSHMTSGLATRTEE